MVALRTGLPLQGVVMGVFNPREGAYRWISIAAVPLVRPGETSAFQVYTVFEDITGRKQAEEAVRNSRKQLQDIIDGSPGVIFLKDLEGRFITANQAFERFLGVTREELRGKTDYDLITREPSGILSGARPQSGGDGRADTGRRGGRFGRWPTARLPRQQIPAPRCRREDLRGVLHLDRHYGEETGRSAPPRRPEARKPRPAGRRRGPRFQ